MARLRIGSRGSQLALWQANHIAARLRERGHETEIEVIRTTGDRLTEVPLAQVGTKGMFTQEIEEALLAGGVQLAVHSLKDLPTDLADEFVLAAIPARDAPYDVLLSARHASLEALPEGARVGTSSLRRQAQLRHRRPDLVLEPLRGNVDTRLRKLESGEFAAIILAAAGVSRLGLTAYARQVFDAAAMCPAAGQGALAIETRADDAATREAVSFLDDPAARRTTACERALLRGLGGGCQVPIGAFAELAGLTLSLTAVVARPDGSRLLRETGQGDDAEQLGMAVAESLLRQGADAILREVYQDGSGRGAAAPQQP